MAWISVGTWNSSRTIPCRNVRGSLALRASLQVETVPTKPIAGQKTGTSGMRKKSKVILEEPNFVWNWAQSLFDAVGPENLRGKTLVLGGDGRFFNRQAAQIFISSAAANGISRVLVGRDGILSTPAVSAAIIRRKAYGGIIMTASHNPGGKHADWGVKYNVETGSPATEILLDRVYERTLNIDSYKKAVFSRDVDLSQVGEFHYGDGDFTLEIVDSTTDHLHVLRRCFDFEKLRAFVARPDFSFCFDAMNAAGGPAAYEALVKELHAPAKSVINFRPLEDFGGNHPDPNLTYAKELVDHMDPAKNSDAPDLGAASDGDGDRNMILGRGFFVTPSDSLAVIADYATRAIPYFANGVKGLARSMPTSGAVDKVADALDIDLYETPTGWKYFGNLMEANMLSICGEESFGIGSDHIREKDGLWAVLAWLSILAYRNTNTEIGSLVTVEQIVREHWKRYGRHFYTRYDYENVSSEGADAVMNRLRALIGNKDVPLPNGFEVSTIDEFCYKDPVDGSRAERQGVRILLIDGSRIVVRLSGTGSVGATIRIYIEFYEPNDSRHAVDTAEAMAPLVAVALHLTSVHELTGQDGPTVIT
eukprot:CAMPEP_0198737778 /NCGR_PEP_ID=MMETSP1475-20131203/68039_1 /TAXON_ID= ORGANISM="Unidentified sp., Strain CCMP1999" /NCGR_SAMPLE_ID=MMETSP1475 /ASSEMBLY_ACC=CAM_ASM_001111 /LENGTH=591 /DNA_ID=CAMNT_0044501645 /DNA_START=1602 /DNA_END=3377 /DNA_ORIENTATION=-